ncbi:uracil-DNA glycosylase [Bacillus gobiensis]|uniref:uracil-DNA glycosylase n=1 Tax=Bacillus gobiensis TaxID=1441095 RepID=UPI003D1CCCCC
MDIPIELLDACKKRISPFQVEGFLLGGGSETAEIMIVGEAPGEQEIIKEIPFCGRAGVELDRFLEHAELNREEIYITSTVRSRPFRVKEKIIRGKKVIKKENRKPNKKEVIAHAPLLDYQIKKIKPYIVVALGAVAYERLTGKKEKMTEIHGQACQTPILELDSLENNQLVMGEEEYILFPTFHPASIFYNRSLLPLIYEDFEKLKQLSGGTKDDKRNA